MKHWIILMLVITSGGAAAFFGGKWYADQGIHKYYQALTRTEKNYEIRLDKFDMGSLQGEAQWSFKIVLNPCRPDGVLKFIGTDHIERHWNGYHIQSNLVLQNPPAVWKEWQTTPIRMTQDMNWVGKVSTKMIIPKIDKLKIGQGIELSSADLEVHLQAEPLDEMMTLTQMLVKSPQLSLMTAQKTLNLEDLEWTTNQGLNKALFEAGEMGLNIKQANFESFNGQERYYFQLNDYTQQLQTLIQEPLVQFKNAIHIQKIEFNGQRAIENIHLKSEVDGLQRVLINQIFKIIEQSQNSCVASESFKTDFDQAFMLVLNEGMNVKLTENTMEYEGQAMTLDAHGTILPNYEKTPKSFVSSISKLVNAQLKAQFDPQMVSIVFPYASVDPVSKLNSQNIEQVIQTLEEKHKATRSGRLVRMESQYQMGNFN